VLHSFSALKEIIVSIQKLSSSDSGDNLEKIAELIEKILTLKGLTKVSDLYNALRGKKEKEAALQGELISLADKLDRLGLIREAGVVDAQLKKTAELTILATLKIVYELYTIAKTVIELRDEFKRIANQLREEAKAERPTAQRTKILEAIKSIVKLLVTRGLMEAVPGLDDAIEQVEAFA
jgi:hypothetical protein